MSRQPGRHEVGSGQIAVTEPSQAAQRVQVHVGEQAAAAVVPQPELLLNAGTPEGLLSAGQPEQAPVEGGQPGADPAVRRYMEFVGDAQIEPVNVQLRRRHAAPGRLAALRLSLRGGQFEPDHSTPGSSQRSEDRRQINRTF